MGCPDLTTDWSGLAGVAVGKSCALVNERKVVFPQNSEVKYSNVAVI